MAKFSARAVAMMGKPGRHADGDGLYLVVDTSGAKRWLFMFTWAGKRREMGLGGLSKVSLAAARDKASEARALLGQGINPLEARQASNAAPTFGVFADAYIKAQAPGWKGAKTEPGWRNTIENHAAALTDKRLDSITTADVEAVLLPLWTTKAETAQKLQNRLERILDAAKAKKLRSGDNPARWRGHLEHLLSKRLKLTKGHHPSMPFAALPAFMAALDDVDGMGALALKFAILTASREAMVTEAVWSEIDLPSRMWTIPAVRMKGDINEARGKAFQIPLSAAAIAVLEKAGRVRFADPKGPDYVFLSAKPGSPMSNSTMDKVLDLYGAPWVPEGERSFVPHGFRSTFRDWAGEETDFEDSVVEFALAHKVGTPTERAYRRASALKKRVKLMEAWGRFALSCRGSAGNRLRSVGDSVSLSQVDHS